MQATYRNKARLRVLKERDACLASVFEEAKGRLGDVVKQDAYPMLLSRLILQA